MAVIESQLKILLAKGCKADPLSIALAHDVTNLTAQVQQLRERCQSDPWWWAYSEYLDEGWCGPFETREAAEKNAEETTGEPHLDDDGRVELSFRQHSNTEGCAENEALTAQVQRMQPVVDSALSWPEACPKLLRLEVEKYREWRDAQPTDGDSP